MKPSFFSSFLGLVVSAILGYLLIGSATGTGADTGFC